MSQNQIDWDPRPSVRDGGRDIVVQVGNPLGTGHFIPERPSLWSVKSGADGIDPNKLKREILKQKSKDHPKVRQALRNGKVLIWCALHAASHDQREKMRHTARAIARKLRVRQDSIQFRWIDELVDQTNRLPNLIAIHMPDVDKKWFGVRTLNEWRREPGLNTPWCEFGARAALVTRIADHLLARESPNVLHIAGLSGIGKTRTVMEACSRQEELRGVFYADSSTALTASLERALHEADRVFVVIDETPLDQIDAITARFADCPHRVRIVTIGPASRQRAVARQDVVIVPEPESEEDILAVIRSPGSGLSDEVLRSIAARSAHDLRLALMLVKASLLTPELRTIPIVDFNGVWDRLMRLFRPEIRDPVEFVKRYETLTVAIDVGVEAEMRPELQCLSGYFGQPEGRLLDCANVASQCGLGLRVSRFFEASPHAFAIGLFGSLFRRQLRDRLSEFMGCLPFRLHRRFLERCHECSDDIREEVAAEVGGVFLEWLGDNKLASLAEREPSRIFQAWAEFDPSRGLAWLRKAVESATPEELHLLDGEADGSGGWRGRRQLVWLCQNLAAFREHFADCETVLFCFAQHETEQIGNNSTAVWRSLFWPVLSHTELPFPERFPVLLGRLENASEDDLLLLLSAVIESLGPQLHGLPNPPLVVGGRNVPTPWMPESQQQWRALRVAAAQQAIETVKRLSADFRERALQVLIKHLRLFRGLALVDRVKELFTAGGITSDLRLSLVLQLDKEIGVYLAEHQKGKAVDPQIASLEQWRSELTSEDLPTRVRDLTAREPWDMWDEDRSQTRVSALANELIVSPETFQSLQSWFESGKARGAGSLAFAIGRQDVGDHLAAQIREWLQSDQCRAVTTTYLNGVTTRQGTLPDTWSECLDAVITTHPELAVIASSTADVGARGVERILAATDHLPKEDASRLLRVFGYGAWHKELTAEQQVRVLQRLLLLSESGDSLAPGVAVDLMAFWWHDRQSLLDERLASVALIIACRAPTSADSHKAYDWHRVLRLLCPYDPLRVAELVVDVMTSPTSHPWRFDDDNVAVLTEAARSNPDGVMQIVGRAILDRQRRSIFAIDVFHGLFEGIGVEVVRHWVETNGRENLRWIARHFASPTLDSKMQVVVPPLTKWLFTERETDQEAFEWFLMGRHSGAYHWSGNQAAQKRAEMEPFLRHNLRRVREWAKYEIEFTEREDDRFQQFEEESERL